jgi:O-antigen/teichoic acid export membrane protein
LLAQADRGEVRWSVVSDVHSSEELTAATASGLRWTTVVRVGTELLLLGSMVVLARLIPPSAFGAFAVAVIVQELAVNVPSEGVGSALVQRRSIDRDHLQGGLALALVVGAVLTVLTLATAAFVVRPVLGDETAALVALTTPWFLMGAIVALPMMLLRRRLDFRRLALLGLIQSVVRAVATIALAAALGMDGEALVVGGLIAMAAMVAAAFAFAPVPLPRWRTRAIRDILPYGGPAMMACFSWAGFRNGDYAIVGAKLGVAQAGFYWRGFQLSVEYQGKVRAVMNQVAFPVLSRTAGMDELFHLRHRMVRLLTVVLFPALLTLVIVAPVLVPWLFGEAWEPAVVPTQILAGAGAATVVIDAVGTVLMASGRSRAMLGYGVAHFVVYAGAVLLVAGYGLAAISAAAVGVHLIFLFVAYEVMLRARAETTLSLLWRDIGAACGSCAGLAAVALPAYMLLDASGAPALLHIFIVSAVGAIAYLAVLRTAFGEAWRDLAAVLRRVLPARGIAAFRRLALPLPAGRSA